MPDLRSPLARLHRQTRGLARRFAWPRYRHVYLECGRCVVADRRNRHWAKLAREGHHERDVERFVDQWLRPGDGAVDVGAHVGLLTVLMGLVVGPTGRVLAFEPDGANRRALLDAVERHQLSQVEVYDQALSDQDGSATLLRPDGAWGAFLAGPEGEDAAVTGFFHSSRVTRSETSVRRLDSFLRGRPLARLDLLKVDVDGADLAVLQGAAGLLDRHQPAIVSELSTFWSDHGVGAADLVGFLDGRGYATWATRRGDLDARRVRGPDDLRLQGRDDACNLFSLPPDRHADRVGGLWFTGGSGGPSDRG